MPAVFGDRRAPFQRYEFANGALGLFYFRLVELVDGFGGGTLMDVAEAFLDALEAEEGDDAHDAVGQDAESEEDAKECACVFRLAQRQEAQDDAADAQQQHEPPAVVAALLVVDGEDGKRDAFEHHPHGEDGDEGNLGGQEVGGQHEADDDLEHGQQGGGAGIGQEGLCAESEDEGRDAGRKDEQAHEPGSGDEAGAGIEDADDAEGYQQHGGDDEVDVDSFHRRILECVISLMC